MANQANIQAVITADDRASDVIKGVGENANKTAKMVGAGFAIAGAALTAFAKNATDFTVDYVKNAKMLARETGNSVEESSRLLHVTERMGISADEASRSFGIFSKHINEAANTTEGSRLAAQGLQLQIEKTKREIAAATAEIKKHGDKTGDLKFRVKELNNQLESLEDNLTKSANSLDQIGVSTQKADGTTKSFNEILLEVADKFKVMPDGATKTALALDLFGRSGKDMIKVLNLGSQGISDLEQQADKLGLTLTANNIGRISKYIESQKNLKDSTDALKLAVGETTAPILTAFHNKINEIILSLLNTNSGMHDVTGSVLAFGGPVLAASGAVIAFGANLTQIITEIGALKFLLSTPFIAAFEIIGIAAALAALWKVRDAAFAAHDAVQNTKNAVEGLQESNRAVEGRLRAGLLSNDPNIRARSANALKGLGLMAKGGPVIAGTPYIVGELGPEIVVPSQSGTIIPNNKLGGMGTVNININAGALMGNDVEARKFAQLIMKHLNDARGSKMQGAY